MKLGFKESFKDGAIFSLLCCVGLLEVASGIILGYFLLLVGLLGVIGGYIANKRLDEEFFMVVELIQTRHNQDKEVDDQ